MTVGRIKFKWQREIHMYEERHLRVLLSVSVWVCMSPSHQHNMNIQAKDLAKGLFTVG